MADEKDDKGQLDQALSAADDWLRKQGVVTDFSFNTILAWFYVNFEKIQNVELDVDRPKQRIIVRVYLSFWTLFFMTLFRQRDRFLDQCFDFMQEYLPTYEIQIDLVRFRGKSRRLAIDPGPTPENELPDSEGNVLDALRNIRDKKSQKS